MQSKALSKLKHTIALGGLLLTACWVTASGTAGDVAAAEGDWWQFRGPNAAGVSQDTQAPLTWGESQNLKWKTPLPGPGTSSPIIVGDRIFVTCYTGYGVDRELPGEPADLKRHLVCVNRQDGSIAWKATVDAVLPEDPYQGFITEHGYASSTPVTDGERVYVFFGKTGVLAFDLEGNQLWKTGVGTESSPRGWGSGSSPILFEDLVIVIASDESQSLRALNKLTGEEVWKAEAAGLEQTFGTPILVENPSGEKELVVAVPSEVWGFNPRTGKLLWYAATGLGGNISPTPVARDGIVYCVGGRPGGSVAVKTGGDGDVTESHVVWEGRSSSYVPSPVLVGNRLLFVDDRGLLFALNSEDGEIATRERLEVPGGGGFGGRPFYASITRVNDRLYAVSRTNGTFVLDAESLKVLAHNQLPSDSTDFNASPAIDGGQMFLRSNQNLYCFESSADE